MNARLALVTLLLLAATATASTAERDDAYTIVTFFGCNDEWDCYLDYTPRVTDAPQPAAVGTALTSM